MATQSGSVKSAKGFLVTSILAAIFAVALIAVCMPGIRQSYNNSQTGKVSFENALEHMDYLYICYLGLPILPPPLDRIC